MPIGSLVSHTDDDVTGSISRPILTEGLGAEDKRRAKAAMTTALDPQGAGSTVAWDNPESGIKGTFVPVGKAYPENERICRAFLAEIDLKTAEKSLQGTACADKDGSWMVTETKPFKKT
jgi:surface antigen